MVTDHNREPVEQRGIEILSCDLSLTKMLKVAFGWTCYGPNILIQSSILIVVWQLNIALHISKCVA